jgi:hypothetical protein
VVFVLQVDGLPADDDLHPVTTTSVAEAAEEEAAKPTLEASEHTIAAEESVAPGAFDPMEALESAEGSNFDFQIEESQHGGSAIDVGLEESGSDQHV